MDPSQRARFLSVHDLLVQVMDGIGSGSQHLLQAAQSTHGTLAVKNAEVSVDFVLSSTVNKLGISVPGVGASTLLGVGQEQHRSTSTASVKLQIVPIGVVEDTKGKGGLPGSSPAPLPTATGFAPGVLAEALRRHLRATRLDPEKAKLLSAEVDLLEQHLANHDSVKALTLLSRLAERHPEVMTQVLYGANR